MSCFKIIPTILANLVSRWIFFILSQILISAVYFSIFLGFTGFYVQVYYSVTRISLRISIFRQYTQSSSGSLPTSKSVKKEFYLIFYVIKLLREHVSLQYISKMLEFKGNLTPFARDISILLLYSLAKVPCASEQGSDVTRNCLHL